MKKKKTFSGLKVLLTGYILGFKDVLNSRQYLSKNKLVGENAVTQVHGSFSPRFFACEWI